MKAHVKGLFSKNSRISVGDTVELEYKGQKYSGRVMIADYKSNRYIVDIKMRFSDDVRSCCRKRHEISIVRQSDDYAEPVVDSQYDEISSEAEVVDTDDWDDDFLTANMM